MPDLWVPAARHIYVPLASDLTCRSCKTQEEISSFHYLRTGPLLDSLDMLLPVVQNQE